MKLRDHKYSNLMEPNFLGKFSLARKQVKRPKMTEFVDMSVTTAFFSGLAHYSFFYILHEVEGP